MPNATRKLCDYPNCNHGPPDANQLPTPFITSVDLRTRGEVSDELKQHVEVAHMLIIRQEEAVAKRIEMEAEKMMSKVLSTTMIPA